MEALNVTYITPEKQIILTLIGNWRCIVYDEKRGEREKKIVRVFLSPLFPPPNTNGYGSSGIILPHETGNYIKVKQGENRGHSF